jgi:hypothetical protein
MTSIEWLIKELEEHIVLSAHGKLGTNRTGDYRIGLRKAIDFCHEAREMHKQEIIDAHISGQPLYSCQSEKAEQYYQETFKQK